MQLFSEKISDKETKKAFQNMYRQIKNKGDKLSFLMKIDDEGWFAECREFPSIIAGGSKKDPTEEEILRSIIEAIKVAFGVPVTRLRKIVGKPPAIERPPIKVKLEREFFMPNYL